MGTPAFAISPLQQILESDHKVVAVITAPNRKSGRGKKLTPSPIKVFCEEHDLPVLQPPNLKDLDLITQLRELAPDVIVVVAFRMLPKEVWSIPTYGTFNLHASLLPKYRGAAPIHWAIINGEQQTGVTTFFINEQIDTGEIIAQKFQENNKHLNFMYGVGIDSINSFFKLDNKLKNNLSEPIFKILKGNKFLNDYATFFSN